MSAAVDFSLQERRAIRAGKDAVQQALAAGLPGSVAIFAGDAAHDEALGSDEWRWSGSRLSSMVASGMSVKDATAVLEATVARLQAAEVWPWR